MQNSYIQREMQKNAKKSMVFFAPKQDSRIMPFCFFQQIHYPLIYST